MRITSLYIFLIVFGITFKTKTLNNNYENQFIVKPSFSSYVTAMGKGKGILFKITVLNTQEENFSIDSFYVNGKSLAFNTLPGSHKSIQIEANYLKSKEEPSVNANGVIVQPEEIKDPIINEHRFFPSFLVISYKGKKIRKVINEYKNTN